LDNLNILKKRKDSSTFIDKSWSDLKNIIDGNSFYYDYEDFWITGTNPLEGERKIYLQRNSIIVYQCLMPIIDEQDAAYGTGEYARATVLCHAQVGDGGYVFLFPPEAEGREDMVRYGRDDGPCGIYTHHNGRIQGGYGKCRTTTW